MDLEKTIANLYNAVLPPEEDVVEICRRLVPILLAEENLLVLEPPITIVGDIHGQFFDLLKIFRMNGPVPEKRYLFLGDCVDRGAHSVETILLLLCLKIRHGSHVFLLRGNHESLFLSKAYGFKDECWEKYDLFVYLKLCDLFELLPLAAVVNREIFCVHGGLVPDLTLDLVNQKSRLDDIPKLVGLLWSDPSTETQTFLDSPRGSGHLFGACAVEDFLAQNGLKYIVRSHQLVQDGYSVSFGCVYTVWSAPNYCYTYGNLASIMIVKDDGDFELLVYDKCENQLGISVSD